MRKIIVIDDEEGIRQIVMAALGDEGYEVLQATNGADGFVLTKEHLPELVLCDVNMPGLDGYATLEKIRKEPVTAAIPVILMTGVLKDYANVRHAMGIGADDYLLKPFTVDDLLAAIQTRLKKQELVVEKAESKLSELRSNITLSLPHELRTPLVAILGFADLLKTYYETMDRKEIGTMAADIHSSATRLHSLIEKFLIYAQIEMMGADETKLKALRTERTLDLHKFVKILSTQKAAEFGRETDTKLGLQDGSARISLDYFGKIVGGLLDNAFKFSEPGTPVQVSCSTSDGWFIITISDKGRGMAAHQIKSVGGYMQFERTIHEQQGSGLGLIIAKRLTDLHGGTFTIESKPGTGTTIEVKIPSV